MFINNLLKLAFLFFLTNVADAAYSAGGPNIAAYWGQGASGQKSLGEYCEQGAMDIAVVSFVNNFQGGSVSFNFGGSCGGASCPTIAKDIKTCQSKGIKVLLSMGGAVGNYGVSSAGQAKETAQKMYKMFGPKGTVFPGTTIDGIDLDIESGNHAAYPSLVSEIKSAFGSKFLVSAAPQCVYPDQWVGDALLKADIDMAFIQFYNNACNVDKTFNWEKWSQMANTQFKNKNMKLYVGLPGSSKAAGSGYIAPDKVASLTASAKKDPKFGGYMVWDAASGGGNVVNGKSFLSQLRSILGLSATGIKGSSGGQVASGAGAKQSNTVHGYNNGKGQALLDAVTTTAKTGQLGVSTRNPTVLQPYTTSAAALTVQNAGYYQGNGVANNGKVASTTNWGAGNSHATYDSGYYQGNGVANNGKVASTTNWGAGNNHVTYDSGYYSY